MTPQHERGMNYFFFFAGSDFAFAGPLTLCCSFSMLINSKISARMAAEGPSFRALSQSACS